MKKLILTLFLAIGTLFTQAQVSPCDSLTITGSQSQLSINANSLNPLFPVLDYWETTAGNTILAQDTLTNSHTVYNSNPATGLPYDTIITCISLSSAQVTCCVTWIWNGTMWMRMGIAQPTSKLV